MANDPKWAPPDPNPYVRVSTSPYDDSRSFLEPFSNTLMIQIEPPYQAALLLQGLLPKTAFFKFLHEFTHYWCFSSVFGFALQIQFIKAYRDAGDINWNREMAMRFVLYEAALRFFQPLGEGLAQFAEYDAWLPVMLSENHVEDLASPLEWAARVFVRPNIELEDYADEIRTLISSERVELAAVTRKTELLLHPLEDDPAGYLGGYLTVKYLWRLLACRDSRFCSSNFCLQFLREYFYEDLNLVDLLFSTSVTVEQAFSQLTHYLTRRFEALKTCDIDAELRRQKLHRRALDVEMSPNRKSLQLAYDIPGLNPVERRARDSFLRTYQTIISQPPDYSDYDLQAIFDRQFTPVASITFKSAQLTGQNVHLTTQDNEHLVLPIDREMAWAVRMLSPSPKTPVFLELWVSLIMDCAILIAGYPGINFYTRTFGDAPEGLIEYFQNHMVQRLSREMSARSSEQLVRGATMQVLGEGIFPALEAAAGRCFEQLYLPYSLAFLPSNRHASARSDMAQDGFLALAGGKVAGVRALAQASLLGSMNVDVRFAEAALQERFQTSYGTVIRNVAAEANIAPEDLFIFNPNNIFACPPLPF